MNTTNMNSPSPDGSFDAAADQTGSSRAGATQWGSTPSGATAQPSPEQPLYAPLPYGTDFSSPQPLGFGVGPADVGLAPSGSAGSAIEVAERKRAGSPVLAVAGLLSLAVAIWAILGAPVITPTVLLACGLVLTVLVGLVMVIRR